MAIDVAKLLITVGADISGAEKGLAKVSDRMDNFAAKAQYAGKILTLGMTTPLVAFGVKATMAASDLSESMNKINVVFEQSGEGIKEWSEDATTNLGISQQAALEATGTFGNLFVTMGLGQGAAADMSMELVQLASDLGSFNNIDPSIVLEKLRAGLVGEVEPLRVLGVNVQESVVQLKALEMGLAATKEELTNQDKVMARYAIIMEQTTTAQGDFARTSEGLANMLRTTKATLIDASAALGEVLMPYVLQGVGYVKDLLEQVTGLDEAQKRSIVTWGAVAAAIGPALLVLSTMTKVMGGGIQMAVGLGGAITTLGKNLAAAQAAYQAGLTLTTSLQVGFGAAAAALGPLAIALGVAVAAWVLYNETIGKTAKELQELQKVKMDEYFKRQTTGVATAESALDDYLATYKALSQEVTKRGVLDAFVNLWAGAEKFKDSAKELGGVVAGLGGDYEEYAESVIRAAYATGVLTEQGLDNALAALRQGGPALDKYTKSLGVMSQAEFAASKEASVLNGIVEELGGTSAIVATGMDASNSQIERFIQEAKLFSPAAAQMTEEQKAIAEAAENVRAALVSVGLAGELQGGIETYTETIAGLRDEYMALLDETNAALDRGFAPSSTKVRDLTEAMRENAGAQQDAAAAMRDATTEMIFQQAAAGLGAQATLTLARAMGVLSEEDYLVANSIQALKDDFSGIDAIMDPKEAAGYAEAVQNLNLAIQNLVEAGLPVTIENINSALANMQDTGDMPVPDASLWTDVENSAGLAAVNIKNGWTTNMTETSAAAKTAVSDISTAFTGEDWSAVGVGVAAGMAAGITAGVPQIEAAARAAARAAYSAAMEELGIQSPSKEFAWIGEQTMAGMALGIRENAKLPVREAAYAANLTTAGATYYSTYSPNVTVSANVASEIDIYRMAQEIADEIRMGRL